MYMFMSLSPTSLVMRLEFVEVSKNLLFIMVDIFMNNGLHPYKECSIKNFHDFTYISVSQNMSSNKRPCLNM